MSSYILFGGSFDPLHNGHLRIAEYAANALRAEVIFIPAKKARWKEMSAAKEDRFRMVEEAVAGYPLFSISRLEMDRAGEESYSIDTVREFHRLRPLDKGYLLIGGDQVNKFDGWKEAEEIASLAQIVYVPRPGIRIDEEKARRYKMIELPFYGSGAISSTEVRSLSDFDVPESVRAYIERHSLYYMGKLRAFLSEKRLRHSLSVAHLCQEIMAANRMNDSWRGYIAGLLHDISREMPDEKAQTLLRGTAYPYKDAVSWKWHQWTGAILAEKEFGITDREILDAIASHTTGDAGMSPLAMILYAADKVDPARGWDSQAYVRALKEDYKEGFIEVLRANRAFLEEKEAGSNDDAQSRRCFEFYLKGE